MRCTCEHTLNVHADEGAGACTVKKCLCSRYTPQGTRHMIAVPDDLFWRLQMERVRKREPSFERFVIQILEGYAEVFEAEAVK